MKNALVDVLFRFRLFFTDSKVEMALDFHRDERFLGNKMKKEPPKYAKWQAYISNTISSSISNDQEYSVPWQWLIHHRILRAKRDG